MPSVMPTEQLTPDIPVTEPLPASTPTTAMLAPTVALAPTAVPVTSVGLPTPKPAVIVVPRTAVPQNNEQRWRTQQLDRKILEPRRLYVAKNPVTLWWYDPLTGQSVAIGTLVGDFPVQALFTLRNEQRPALEVPYTINGDFGLTSISEAVRQRMEKAGYTRSVEAYVFQTDDVQPK